MPTISGRLKDLRPRGAVFQGEAAVPKVVEAALKLAKQPVPTPIGVAIHVDTGAATTAVSHGLPGKLGLHPIGAATVNSATTLGISCPIFMLRLVLPKGIVFHLPVVESAIAFDQFDVLLGRDLLAHGLFVYNGQKNFFELTF